VADFTSIKDIRDVGDISVLYKWRFEFVSEPFDINSTKQPQSRRVRTQLLCDLVELPKQVATPIEINFGHYKTLQSGPNFYTQSLQITFFDDEELSVTTFFDQWAKYNFNPKTGVGHKMNDVMVDTILTRQNKR